MSVETIAADPASSPEHRDAPEPPFPIGGPTTSSWREQQRHSAEHLGDPTTSSPRSRITATAPSAPHEGIRRIRETDLTTVLLRHWPELAPALDGAAHGFAPSNAASSP